MKRPTTAEERYDDILATLYRLKVTPFGKPFVLTSEMDSIIRRVAAIPPGQSARDYRKAVNDIHAGEEHAANPLDKDNP